MPHQGWPISRFECLRSGSWSLTCGTWRLTQLRLLGLQQKAQETYCRVLLALISLLCGAWLTRVVADLLTAACQLLHPCMLRSSSQAIQYATPEYEHDSK